MKRSIPTLMIFLMFLALQPTAFAEDEAPADEGPVLNPTASLFTRYELRQHYSPGGLNGSDFIRYRARFGTDLDNLRISDSLVASIRFVPQASGFWHVGGSSLEDASLGLHEGYLSLNADRYRLDIGRFEMAYGEHLMIGTVGWHHTGRSFDGARFHYAPWVSGAYIDAFFTTLNEGLVDGPFTTPWGAGDQYFAGLYSGFGPSLAEGMALDTYLLARIWPTNDNAARESATQLTIGARNKYKVGSFDYRLEAGAQFGTRRVEIEGRDNPKIMAFQGDLEAGVTFGDSRPFRVSLEGFFASGDDPETDELENWDQHFPTAHKWLGYMDIIGGRSNVYGGALHLSYKINDAWRVSADAHAFWRPEVGEDVDSLVGYEVDTGVLYIIGQGLKLRAGLDIFLPNDDASDDLPYFFELELKYTL